MEIVMRGLQWHTLLVYLDDVIVFSSDFDSHLTRLEDVFKRLRAAHLKLKPSKCALFAREVDYLGHRVSKDGVHTDPKKIEAVQNWPTPRHKTDVRSFLGMTSYYRRFIDHYTELVRPLSQITTMKAVYNWDDTCESSFQTLKQKLMEAPVLAYPDFQQPFILDTDASNLATGAVLSQIIEGEERVIAYYSKALKPEEKNYCVTRKELLAIIKAVKHFRCYLLGQMFTIRTDHSSIRWLLNATNPGGQLARWMATLAEYRYKIEFRPGGRHGNADGLSRQQCGDCQQCQRQAQPQIRQVQQMADLAIKQKNDVYIAPIYKIVQQQREVTDDDRKTCSWETKKMMELRDHMEIQPDGTLVVVLPRNGQRRAVRIAPTVIQEDIIQAKHASAHFGIGKLIARLRLDWYWPGLTSQVRRYVNNCLTCQRSKSAKTKTSGAKQHLYAGRPWQICAVDLVGPFQPTKRGNRWILVVTDHFRRWSDAIALPNAHADTIVDVLDERIFVYLGVPEQIHTDQGSQFESAHFKAFCRLWGAKKTRTAPYNPTANGIVERGNKVLGAALRALLHDGDTEEWDVYLPQIMRTVRATPHTSTGETANFMMMGREARLPEALVVEEMTTDTWKEEEYAKLLGQQMRIVHQQLRGRQNEVRLEDGEEPPVYQVGDQVWLKSFHKKKGKSSKLMPKYVGPYTIAECLPHHVYRMERGGKLSIPHEGRIRLYISKEQTDRSNEERTNNSQPVLKEQPVTLQEDQGLNRYLKKSHHWQGRHRQWRRKHLPQAKNGQTIMTTRETIAPDPTDVRPDLPYEEPALQPGEESNRPASRPSENSTERNPRYPLRSRQPPRHLQEFVVI